MQRFLFLFCLSFLAVSGWAQGSLSLYNNLIDLHDKGEYEACIKLEKEVVAFAGVRKDTIASNSFFYLGNAFNQLGDLKKAISYWEKERSILVGLGLKEELSYTLYNLASIYLRDGNYPKAKGLADELLAGDKKLYAPTSEEFVSTVTTVAEIYFQMDRLRESEKLLQNTLKQQDKGSVNQGLLLTRLGDLYTYTGEYSRALQTLTRAGDVLKSTLNDGSAPYLRVVINLGILFMEQGKYPEAEEQFETALKILSPEEAEYVPALSNMALVYQSLGQFERSEKTFIEIKKEDSLAVGTDSPDYAITLTNLGLVYIDEGKFKEAESAILRALDIQKKNGQEQSASYARKLNNLAKVYVYSGAPEKAIPLYEQALAIFKKVLGENNAEFATTSYNLGVAYLKTGKGEAGIKFVKSSATIRAAVLGKKHPKYTESLQKIGEYQWQMKQRKEARQTFGQVFDNYYFQIETTFPALTEEEKAKFYYNNIKPSFEKFNSFAVEYSKEDPSILSEVYNHQLNTKAVIMMATEKVKEAIYASNKPTLISQFESWQALKEQIAKFYSQNQQPGKLDSLLLVADRTEKELTRESADFAKQFIRKKYTWQEVQKKLQPSEAAVEIVRYRIYSPEAGGNFGNEVAYAFMVVTPQTKVQPDIISMKNGNNMEGKFLHFYRNSMRFSMDDPNSYRNFFEPLGDYLTKNGIKKVYFSPDGAFNQINVNTISNPATKKFMLDEFDIVQITNTRELVDVKPVKPKSQASVLMGFPKFNVDNVASEGQKGETRSMRALRGTGTTRGLNRGLRGGLLRYVNADNGIAELPGTQKEIQIINGLFGGAKPSVFTELQATESEAKKLKSPRILHVATHGYFLEDGKEDGENKSTQYVFNPLLKSGLILAGAENFLTTGIPVDSTGNDGVLTAYEAMNLNLDDTQLVVLSACETGLGEIKNGEGVYGLQRAFKLSGAQGVVMSLWSVDDEATQELMTTFYAEFLKSNNAHEALRTSQQKLKVKYPSPFYWGAFVLVGM